MLVAHREAGGDAVIMSERRCPQATSPSLWRADRASPSDTSHSGDD